MSNHQERCKRIAQAYQEIFNTSIKLKKIPVSEWRTKRSDVMALQKTIDIALGDLLLQLRLCGNAVFGDITQMEQRRSLLDAWDRRKLDEQLAKKRIKLQKMHDFLEKFHKKYS
jgi:hypothetical protein